MAAQVAPCFSTANCCRGMLLRFRPRKLKLTSMSPWLSYWLN